MSQATVLIVDDQPDSLKWIYEILQTRGFRVLLANSGELALETIGHVSPDLVLLDVQMSGMDGFEVCRRLKADPATRDIPVLFLSVAETAAERIEGFHAGAVDFIEKPFAEEEVVLRVQTHWDLRRLQKDLEARVQDRTRDLQAALEDRKLLMRELQHRVKNHLTLVTGLLSLTEATAREGESASDLLAKARSRVQAMATVYDLLYHSENFTGLSFSDYGRQLVEPWVDAGATETSGVRLVSQFEPIVLPTDLLVPLGLILTELVTNALKYAFPDGRAGTITVGLVRREGELSLTVEDNGQGFAEGNCPEERQGLGWQLVGSLVRQLKGRWTCRGDDGTRIEVRFPDPGSLGGSHPASS